MSTVYVREQGARLSREGGRLMVRKSNAVLGDMPLAQVSQLVLMGNVQLTAPLMTYCLNEAVDVCFLSARGVFRGRLTASVGHDGRLRCAQYQHHQEEHLALPLAKALVAGKLHNQMAFWQRRRPEGIETASALADARDLVPEATGLEALRGVEGAAAVRHFRALSSVVPSLWAFTGNRDRPAHDPINAMLNLGYWF